LIVTRWIALAILVLGLVAGPAIAQQRPVSIAVSGGPEELTIDRGQSATTSMIVRNPADYAQDVEIVATGLEIRDNDYSMVGEVPRGMTVTIEPETFTVPAGGGQDVQVAVSMAADAEPGGQYAGVVVRGLPVVESGESPVTGEIALPLLVTVPGDVIEEGSIAGFAADDPTVEIGAEATFTIDFANTGNVHYPVRGVVQLFDGPRPLGVVDVPEGAVLPGTTKQIAVRWIATAPAGEVRAVAQLTWGKQGQLDGTAETTFELVAPGEDPDGGGSGREVIQVERRSPSRSLSVPAGIALLLLLLMLALLFRWALQRGQHSSRP
jgi:hypothetical protein